MNLATNLKGGVPYQPWAADLVKKRGADLAKDHPNVRCLPRGAVRVLTDDYYKRFFQTPDRLLILTERNMAYRQIFTDGRPPPPDPEPDLERLLRGEVGWGHAGHPNRRFPRRIWGWTPQGTLLPAPPK